MAALWGGTGWVLGRPPHPLGIIPCSSRSLLGWEQHLKAAGLTGAAMLAVCMQCTE